MRYYKITAEDGNEYTGQFEPSPLQSQVLDALCVEFGEHSADGLADWLGVDDIDAWWGEQVLQDDGSCEIINDNVAYMVELSDTPFKQPIDWERVGPELLNGLQAAIPLLIVAHTEAVRHADSTFAERIQSTLNVLQRIVLRT